MRRVKPTEAMLAGSFAIGLIGAVVIEQLFDLPWWSWLVAALAGGLVYFQMIGGPRTTKE